MIFTDLNYFKEQTIYLHHLMVVF